MKFLVMFACLMVCFVSLPVTSQGLAEGEITPDVGPISVAVNTFQAVEEAPAAADTAASDAEASEAAESTSNEAATKEEAADDATDDKNSDAQPAAEESKAADEKKDEETEADKSKDSKDEKAKSERKTHTVKTKRLKVDVTLDGTFVAEKMTEVALRPESWSQFEIVEIVDHGTQVHEGEVIVKFDRGKIDKEIDELELSQRLSELAIRKAEEDLPRLEKTLAMNAEEAERRDKNAKEDYDYYHEVDRPLLIKSVEYSLKYAQFNLEYEQEELDQLEKMYEADDLTEETEEIVLKRQRSTVEFAEFNLEQTKQYCDEILNIRLPRADIQIKDSLDRAALALARARSALAIDLNRARYELEQQKQSRAKSLERHAELTSDRNLMEIKAPVDGVVYYGECEDGKWSNLSSLRGKLKPYNNASANSVLMTILQSRPLGVEAQVGEDKLPDVTKGRRAKIVPPVEGSKQLDAKVKSVSAVPVTTGKFNVNFDLTGSELPDWIVAGMSCKVKVLAYDKADALVVPKKAVHTDDYDEEVKYVWLVDPDDDEAKPERRDVKVGRSSGDDLEIAKGLKKGDVISLDDESEKEDE